MMIHHSRNGWANRGGLAGLLCVCLASFPQFAAAQNLGSNADQFLSTQSRTDPRNSYGGHRPVPTLSEATAILEAAVRSLYKHIEPGEDPSPNELIAYADLRALRLYTGALEVAGWDLEQAAQQYQDMDAGRFRGRVRDLPTDARVAQARERYLAFRETVRTLLYRVRSTAVAVEHQVSFCDPQVNREWQEQVVPALLDTISATKPLFIEQEFYTSYGVPGSNRPRVIPTGNSVPQDAVEVARSPLFRPFNGQGRGQGRYFEIRAFGGPVRVKRIRYVSHESNFGVIGTTVQRELTVDQIASPSEPLYIPCNRDRFVDLSQLEVEWENADTRRNALGTIDVISDRPDNGNN